MKRFRFIKPGPCFFLLVLLGGIALLSGCATTEPDNLSVRPWNSPKDWESGLPGGLLEGR